MRVFANLFLILFLADGCFSLVDELVSLLTPLMPFTELRNFLAFVVIVMSIPVYLSLGIDQRLPKRVFLPLIFFIFWTLICTWLFTALAGNSMYGLFMAAVQVAVGMLPLVYFRKGSERCLTMPPALFTGQFFSLKNTMTFSAVNLLVIPLALVMLFLTVADAYMAEYTAGFMHLAPGGLKMTERIYKRDNRTIRLSAMIHVGNKEYYDALADSLALGRTIVLAEGVTDDKNLMRNRIDYGKVAGFLGLTSQEKMLFRGRLIDAEELESSRPAATNEIEQKKMQPDILRADVDVSSFRQPTILFLNAIGEHLRESPTFLKGFMALNSWAEKNLTPDMQAIIMDDILHRRNMEVIRYLEKSLDRYDTVVIPWGALHMKEIEMEILKRGFTLQEERKRVSIDFKKMLLGKIQNNPQMKEAPLGTPGPRI